MRMYLSSALCLTLTALSACDEVAVANNPEALAELRSQKSCIRAVEKHTGVSGGKLNKTIPIVETQQYVIDLPNTPSWTCYTDASGNASQLIQTRLGTSAG